MSLPVEFLLGADADLQGAFNRFEDHSEIPSPAGRKKIAHRFIGG
jgi:hypothetical protein